MCEFHILAYRISFINDTETTEIYTLSLHDALPILRANADSALPMTNGARDMLSTPPAIISEASPLLIDRKSTRLNSSHRCISYAVFCLKKKNSIILERKKTQTMLVSLLQVT